MLLEHEENPIEGRFNVDLRPIGLRRIRYAPMQFSRPTGKDGAAFAGRLCGTAGTFRTVGVAGEKLGVCHCPVGFSRNARRILDPRCIRMRVTADGGAFIHRGQVRGLKPTAQLIQFTLLLDLSADVS